jgi:hypothetical protein
MKSIWLMRSTPWAMRSSNWSSVGSFMAGAFAGLLRNAHFGNVSRPPVSIKGAAP